MQFLWSRGGDALGALVRESAQTKLGGKETGNMGDRGIPPLKE